MLYKIPQIMVNIHHFFLFGFSLFLFPFLINHINFIDYFYNKINFNFIINNRYLNCKKV